MGKVNLKGKNRSEKGADFKRRSANLGHGKHKHLSHTVIDLQTATLKMPRQMKFENVPVERTGTTTEQFEEVLLLCHGENERKIISGLSRLNSMLPKATDFIAKRLSEIFAAILHHLRHPMPKVRELAHSIVHWLFTRQSQGCVPFLSVFIRHVGAAASSPSAIIKDQGVFLLDRISTLPNLQPVPILLELLPEVCHFSVTSDILISFMRCIAKVLKKFLHNKSSEKMTQYAGFHFPRLFPSTTATFSVRYRPQCVLGISEMENLNRLVNVLKDSLNLIIGRSDGMAALSSLLLTIRGLDPYIELSTFINFASKRFPDEKATRSENVQIAKLLVIEPQCHPEIRDFLREIEISSDILPLAAAVGAIDENHVSGISECVAELCCTVVSEAAGSTIAKLVLNELRSQQRVTKRVLRLLISLKKPEDFQENFLPLFQEQLMTCTSGVRELLLVLIGSCAPLKRGFLKELALFLVDESVSEDLCVEVVRAVGNTNGITDDSCLMSFLMTVGSRRIGVREEMKRELKRLELLVDDSSRELFARLDLTLWKLV
jgi:hypothetical protein